MFSPELVEGSNAVMLHLWSRGINCTRPVVSRRGLYTEMVQGKNIAPDVGDPEQEYPVRVLEFVSGILMSELDAKFLTPSFLYRVGSFAGRVSAALEVSHILTGITSVYYHKKLHSAGFQSPSH